MTFQALEISRFRANPIELYTFRRGLDTPFRFTSSVYDEVVGGVTYGAVPISRGKIRASQNIDKTSLKIMMDSNNPFVELFVEVPSADGISISIQQFHKNDPDAEVRSIWLGRVINVKFLQRGSFEVEITCESIFSVAKRNILRRVYGLTCPHILYDTTNCRALVSEFQETLVVSGVDGTSVSSGDLQPFAVDFFAGGYLQLTKDSIVDQRFIVSQTSNEIVMNLPMSRLAPGDSITVLPGCNHNTSDCDLKFNNLDNYGGYPFTPIKNPMGGTPIF